MIDWEPRVQFRQNSSHQCHQLSKADCVQLWTILYCITSSKSVGKSVSKWKKRKHCACAGCSKVRHRPPTRPSATKVAVSFKIIMTTSVTRPCFTTQHQTCKTKTKTKIKITDQSCPKTDGLIPPHCFLQAGCPSCRLINSSKHWWQPTAKTHTNKN